MLGQGGCLMNTNGSLVIVQPMQWASTKDIHEIEPISDKDSEILRELREVLVKHNAIGPLRRHADPQTLRSSRKRAVGRVYGRRKPLPDHPASCGWSGYQYDRNILEILEGARRAAPSHSLRLPVLLRRPIYTSARWQTCGWVNAAGFRGAMPDGPAAGNVPRKRNG